MEGTAPSDVPHVMTPRDITLATGQQGAYSAYNIGSEKTAPFSVAQRIALEGTMSVTPAMTVGNVCRDGMVRTVQCTADRETTPRDITHVMSRQGQISASEGGKVNFAI